MDVRLDLARERIRLAIGIHPLPSLLPVIAMQHMQPENWALVGVSALIITIIILAVTCHVIRWVIVAISALVLIAIYPIFSIKGGLAAITKDPRKGGLRIGVGLLGIAVIALFLETKREIPCETTEGAIAVGCLGGMLSVAYWMLSKINNGLRNQNQENKDTISV